MEDITSRPPSGDLCSSCSYKGTQALQLQSAKIVRWNFASGLEMPETEDLAVGKETPWINNSWIFLNKIDVITEQFVFFSLTYIVGKLVINDIGIGLGNPCLMMPGN